MTTLQREVQLKMSKRVFEASSENSFGVISATISPLYSYRHLGDEFLRFIFTGLLFHLEFNANWMKKFDKNYVARIGGV